MSETPSHSHIPQSPNWPQEHQLLCLLLEAEGVGCPRNIPHPAQAISDCRGCEDSLASQMPASLGPCFPWPV